MFESPIQIAVVLLIALLVFGPQRLPEIGKQIGNALRELKKAGSDVMNSFNTDHEPDHTPYNGSYNYPYENQTSVPYSNAYTLEAAPDLTDYTIAGQPPRDSYDYGYHDDTYSDHLDSYVAPDQASMAAYDIAPAHSEGASSKDHSSVAVADAKSTGELQKEGTHNV